MDGKNQFGIDPESTVDSVINGEAVLENPEDSEKKETTVAPAEDGNQEQQASNSSGGEQSAGERTPASEPVEASTSSKQEDVAADEMKAEIVESYMFEAILTNLESINNDAMRCGLSLSDENLYDIYEIIESTAKIKSETETLNVCFPSSSGETNIKEDRTNGINNFAI